MKKIVRLIFSIPICFVLIFLNLNKGYSQIETILQKKDSTSVKSCMDCHGSLVAKQVKHITKTGKACADCHKNGDAEHPKTSITLEKSVPELCLSCHIDKKELIATSHYTHKVMNDKKACANCHTPHSSEFKKLLLANKRELCLSCHNKEIAINTTKPLPDLDKLYKTSKTIHPPFKSCSNSCHNPHASNDYRLLNSAFPVGNYVMANVDSFALCWECHDSELMTNPKTATATSFRNGDNNLHYVHINGDKGRTCVMCHSPHATNNPHLIKDKINFGSWEFRMTYNANETGGTCAPACHSEKKYTR